MGNELTRQQVEDIVISHDCTMTELRDAKRRYLAHDAAQRAKVEALENHNEVYRSTIDTQATQLNDYVAQLATLTADRDRLREAQT